MTEALRNYLIGILFLLLLIITGCLLIDLTVIKTLGYAFLWVSGIGFLALNVLFANDKL